MAQAAAPIPLFYRIAFLVVDPLIAGSGAYLDLFNPAFVFNSVVPSTIAPYNPLYSFLQHQLAAALLLCVTIDLFLLRKTRELWIWDPVQAGQLLWDIIMVGSHILSLEQQHRLSLHGLRPEDWGSLAVTGGIGLVRIAFLTRLGFGKIENKQRTG